MASLLRCAPRRSHDFVCLTCRNRIRPLRRAQFIPVRSFKTTSLASSNRTTQRAPLQPRRPPSYSTVTATFAAPPSTSGLASLPHRHLLAVSGPDAAKFLQGLVTNNIDASQQSSLYAAFLDARGRVLWDVFIWVWPELVREHGHWGCYIEVDAAEVEALKRHLKRHKLRSKVTIENVNGEGEEGAQVWAAWGEAGEQGDQDHVIARLEDPRAPGLRRYLVCADRGMTAKKVEVEDVQAYHLQRYRFGIPEGPLEIPREIALPMECNFDLNRGIDFKKGCYVGQELTIRTKHTGVVRKRVLPVSLHPSTSATPAIGADIKALDENGNIKKGRPTGKFIAGIGDVGLALCRLENMTSMKVSAEGGSWKPGTEFGVESEEGVVKMRPVLFEWFVLRERELWDKGRTRI